MAGKPQISLEERMTKIFGMDPGAERLTVLPSPGVGSEGAPDLSTWTAPQWVYELAKGSLLPGHVAQGGGYNASDVLDMALEIATLGTPIGAATAPRGALAMGAARKGATQRGALSKITREIVDPDTGIQFKTGQPATFPYIRNTEKAPYLGKTYGQDIEPAGKYMTTRSPSAKGGESFEMGDITFSNPLVIEGGGIGWKKIVSSAYGGKTGKELSNALVKDGYDGIVTLASTPSGQRYTSEIVDLTSFIK